MEVEEVFARFRQIKQGIRSSRKSTSIWFGEHKSQFRGSGYDIVGVDRWRPGQPLRDVSWRLSMRTYPDRLFTIERMEPKQMPTLLLVDLSRSMLFEISRGSNKALLLLDLIGTIGLTRATIHDPVGLLAFSNRVELYLRPRIGSTHVFRMAHDIFERLELARRFPSDRRVDFSVPLRFVAARLHQRHSIVIISDMADLAAGRDPFDVAFLSRLAWTHDIVLLILYDPDEFHLRGRLGFVRIANLEDGSQTVIAARSAPHIRRSIEASHAALAAQLKRKCAVDSIVLTPHDPLASLATFLTTRSPHRTPRIDPGLGAS